jgi:glyoxylase-like metal-dependent hydrolase (beta-lactamase superfamily II)
VGGFQRRGETRGPRAPSGEASLKLPETIRVIERGWLSANNIVLHGRSDAVVVDSGYGAHAPQTLALIERALAGKRLSRLVNTHCHSDHMGGNAAIQKRYACPTSIPEGEAPLIDRWDEQALILAIADQRAERFRYDDTFRDGDTLEMGGLTWQVISAPGHDTHAVMFYSPEARVLISGDALWENGFGVVFPQLFGRETALAETRATLEAIARLEVDTVIPGHGRPFGEVGAALERAFYRLEGYEEDITRLARHCAKVMLSFSLLEKRSMPLEGLPAYVARVPILAELNSRYLRMTPAAMAEWLVKELERAGAARREKGLLAARGE